MRVVVTGATGNVGTAVVRNLLSGGHEVVGVARRTPKTDAATPAGLEWASADLADDSCRPVLDRAMAGADAVVHLAWGFQPSHRLRYLEELGVGGTARMLASAARAGVRHVVHQSSLGAYAPKVDDTPVAESYPTTGIPSAAYSRHKVAAERLLDAFASEHPTVTVTRTRPGIIGQSSAGSSLLRYAVPALVPSGALRVVPVLPIDGALRLSMVHADDVAEAIARVLEGGVGGAFNLAADPVITVDHVASALAARHVQLPAAALRAAAAASWHLHLQQVDPGWVDLAYQSPVLDAARARSELGWSPQVDAAAVLYETVTGLIEARHGSTPALRPRSVGDRVRSLVTRGPVAIRRLP